jgi:hypothetical protein
MICGHLKDLPGFAVEDTGREAMLPAGDGAEGRSILVSPGLETPTTGEHRERQPVGATDWRRSCAASRPKNQINKHTPSRIRSAPRRAFSRLMTNA